ncbi:N/A [soil metagenome]
MPINKRMYRYIPVLLAAVFVGLAYFATTNRTLSADNAILRAVHSIASPWLDSIIRSATNLGDPRLIPIVGLILAIMFLRQKRDQLASSIVIGLVGVSALSAVLKLVYSRVRPELWARLITEPSFSFPSGHAMTSMAFYCLALYLTWNTRWRWSIGIIGAAYVLLVGFSRLYLGVHYPTDVIGGWLACLAWLSALRLLRANSKKSV